MQQPWAAGELKLIQISRSGLIMTLCWKCYIYLTWPVHLFVTMVKLICGDVCLFIFGKHWHLVFNHVVLIYLMLLLYQYLKKFENPCIWAPLVRGVVYRKPPPLFKKLMQNNTKPTKVVWAQKQIQSGSDTTKVHITHFLN